jgi:hypothetical protein
MKPTLTYSMRTLTKMIKSKIQATDMKFWTSTVARDRIRNEIFKQVEIQRYNRNDYNGFDMYKE